MLVPAAPERRPAPIPPAHHAPGLAPWQETRAKQVLSQRLASGVSLAEVARECRLSRGHFCKAFKRSTGASPHAWLTQRRIEAAQALLRDPRQSVAEVALACGFGDQSHLTRVFRRLLGIPPGQWRRAGAGAGVQRAAGASSIVSGASASATG